MQRRAGKCDEVMAGTERCNEVLGGAGRCEEVLGGTARCWEICIRRGALLCSMLAG